MRENELIENIARLHTTELGVKRIKKNLALDVDDVLAYCKALICDPAARIDRRGKNWYISIDTCEITVNASSYTIITAHKTENA